MEDSYKYVKERTKTEESKEEPVNDEKLEKKVVEGCERSTRSKR